MSDAHSEWLAEPSDICLFGATGDLAGRKLYPALYCLFRDQHLPAGCRILGLARSDMARDAFVESIHEKLTQHAPEGEYEPDVWQCFSEMLDYQPLDVNSPESFQAIEAHLSDRGQRPLIHYLSTSPSLYGDICRGLDAVGLAGAQARVVIEKPIGKDLESSRVINSAVDAVFPETSIYRIDHYLGKETVQNLLALRFANGMFEPRWNSAGIDNVQITVAETVGVEGRWGYYDDSGAMRDMVQNHILQLLSLVAMEAPASLDPDAVRDEKVKVLRALRPLSERADIDANTVRGQYRAGAVDGAAVPGYLDEPGCNPESATETFVAIRAEINNWRWAGVPFYLRTGKRMPSRYSEISVQFRDVPHNLFAQENSDVQANRLIIRLQPQEGVQLQMMYKVRGLGGGMRLRKAELNLSTEDFRPPRNAYERLLLDVVRGNQTLFVRRDEVEVAWRWVDQIMAGWQSDAEGPKAYNAGTYGPTAAIALAEKNGHSWNE